MAKPRLQLALHKGAGKGGVDIYLVRQVVGTVDFSPGQVLTKQQVVQLCDNSDLRIAIGLPPAKPYRS